MKKKWSCEEITRKTTVIPESEMQEKLESVWELLQSLGEPPAQNLPKADIKIDVKDSKTKRSAS